MNLRKTVSVTPAMGASTVAGDMVTDPIRTVEGTTGRVGRTFLPDQPSLRSVPALSQNFFTRLFYPCGKFSQCRLSGWSKPTCRGRLQ